MTKALPALSILLALSTPALASVEFVTGPDLSHTNSFYISNRHPLEPSHLILLPVGSVEPRGWLREFLQRQRDGLCGHLGEISAWLQKDDSAWLSNEGKGKYGWEELPYWLRGYIELAYMFDDQKMIAEAHSWIEGVIASQRADGDFGPDQRFGDDNSRDYWANMLMLYCLQSYYEHSHDARVLALMAKYFKYQATVPDKMLLTHYWQKMRGGDNLYSIYWLYNRNGDPELLKIAEKIHRCTANWEMKDNLPNWHNVNIAECFREPAQFFQLTHNPAELQFAYDNFREVRKRYGQVPGGMFGGDENCREGYSDPRQAIETCGMVEQMLSDEMLFQINGDTFWADQCEDVAFNSYPAAVMPDFKSLRYLTAPNMAVSDSKNHAPGIDNGGPFLMMNPFSSRCCQHNHSQGWPYFDKSLWMATPDNGICAALYSASQARVKAGDGTEVRFLEETHYPFEDQIRFAFTASKPVAFPLYLRIPAWCLAPELSVNGAATKIQSQRNNPTALSGSFIRVNRTWKPGDRITLRLPMKVSLRKWTENHNSVSVDYGPLTFSLKIGESYERHDSIKTAIGDSHWQPGADPAKWPSFEIHPETAWNYGLMLNEKTPESSFTLKQAPWPRDNFPFTPHAAPIILEAKAKRIPEWALDRFGLCAVLQECPVRSDEPVETVSLIPMGAARLRICSFPVIGDGPDAKRWTAPVLPKASPYKASASHCFSSDTIEALADGLAPTSSADHSIPRLTWWDHCGSKEWVQYDFPNLKQLSEAEVYWFDDTGTGQCRLPQTLRVLYRDGDGNDWKPVPNPNGFAPRKDDWNRVTFDRITASALRLDVQMKPGFSGGILEWRVK